MAVEAGRGGRDPCGIPVIDSGARHVSLTNPPSGWGTRPRISTSFTASSFMRVRCLEPLRPSLLVSFFALVGAFAVAAPARALDKQGSAHGGASTTNGAEEEDGF